MRRNHQFPWSSFPLLGSLTGGQPLWGPKNAIKTIEMQVLAACQV